MGATEQAHRSLVEKRQQRQQEHAETLQHHGLMPEFYDISDVTEEQGTQTDAGVQAASSDGGTEAEPMDTGSWEPMESGTWGPVRTRRPRSSPMTGTRVPHVAPQVASQEPAGMEDDTSTVNYEMSEAGTVDYGPLDVDDQEMRTSTKRMTAEDGEAKKKLRAMPPPKPKVKVKREAAATAAPAALAALAQTPVLDDEVQVSAIQPNKSSDMAYWKEQSANELRKELKLRDLQRFRDEWAFKSKDQLLEIIRGLIQAGTW